MPIWLKSALPIATIFSFRMLGLFMLIPVFTVFANDLRGATPTLIGVALGGYGLSQGLLQMPLGMLSDRFGRKSILTLGLLLFALGSLLGAMTDSIYGMIVARIIQGTGAIGSVLIALLADLTRDEDRTKGMAVIGAVIGISFSLAMVVSPALTHHFGLAGIFYLTLGLAFFGLLLLHTLVPTPIKERYHADSETKPTLLKEVFANSQLQRLNVGIFLQHFILTATFYALPLILQKQLGQGHLNQSWQFYLPLMVFSFLLMIPFILFAEKKRKVKLIFLIAIFGSALSQLLLAFSYNYWLPLCGFMLIYFIAFNILEANLPSLISRQADPKSKGTAMGIYSTSQFLGIFIGGVSSGFIYQLGGYQAIFSVNGALCLLWLIIAWGMNTEIYFRTLILSLPKSLNHSDQLLTSLQALMGVKEVTLIQEENTLYLRIDKQNYQTGSAEKLINDF